ncbi:hypothetical protein TEQG_08570 [Trichophyton equinum CBS 127.97]|uniref:Uncharacterized protein n=1 Tax=Trichophyton equinum (strain ATCC MYA-4606 / CBS 127.97) TaxID=559882 RepID=F2PHK5_TRIEC|nr:hypothetical protein TEQG_08570 [Trichophyton equinum CBS 127.97]
MEATWAPPDSPSYTAFFNAARQGTVDEIRAAYTSEIDINALQGDGFEGMSALHLACFHNGDVEVVRFLLDHGAEVNILDRDRAGNSYSLHWAANRDRADIVKLLLDRGAEKSRKGFDGRNALGMVLYYSLSPRKVEPKQMETIQVLLDHGFSVDESGMDPSLLGHAAGFTDYETVSFSRHELVKFLLSQGASVNSLDDRLNTPLHLHVSTSQPDERVVRLLLDAGADLSARNTNGETPLLRAVSALHCPYQQGTPHDPQGSASVVLLRRLLGAGSDITALDHLGQTALHILASNSPACTPGECPEKAAQVLLDMGVPIDSLDNKGRTAIDILLEKHTIESRLILHTIENFKLHQHSPSSQ